MLLLILIQFILLDHNKLYINNYYMFLLLFTINIFITLLWLKY